MLHVQVEINIHRENTVTLDLQKHTYINKYRVYMCVYSLERLGVIQDKSGHKHAQDGSSLGSEPNVCHIMVSILQTHHITSRYITLHHITSRYITALCIYTASNSITIIIAVKDFFSQCHPKSCSSFHIAAIIVLKSHPPHSILLQQ